MSIEGSPRTIFIWTLLISVFCVVITLVTFSRAFQRLGSFAACPGAEKITFVDSSGGVVDPVGTQGPTSTRITEMHCAFADGSEKVVPNDQVFLYGLLASSALGAVIGVGLGAVFARRRARATP